MADTIPPATDSELVASSARTTLTVNGRDYALELDARALEEFTDHFAPQGRGARRR
jgi:hypothetical protein